MKRMFLVLVVSAVLPIAGLAQAQTKAEKAEKPDCSAKQTALDGVKKEEKEVAKAAKILAENASDFTLSRGFDLEETGKKAATAAKDKVAAAKKDLDCCKNPKKKGCTAEYSAAMPTAGLSAPPVATTRADAGSAADLQTACNGGSAQDCRTLGSMYESGQGVAKDEAKALALYKKACDGGYALGCFLLGSMFDGGRGVTKNSAKAAQLYMKGEKACVAGDAEGCIVIGAIYEQGAGGLPRDSAKAAQLFQKGTQLHQKACDGGDATSCTSLGVIYFKGQGMPKDEAKALPLFQKACDGGAALGCLNLGSMYLGGQGMPKDEAKARAFFQKACDGGTALGCGVLAKIYAHGQGVAKDDARAARLYQLACDSGQADACTILGNWYAEGRGVAKDNVKAAHAFQMACAGGASVGCINLGFKALEYLEGRGLPKDEAKAVQLFQQACDGGQSNACWNVGDLYENGRGVSKDKAKALALYKKACDGGDASGCNSLKLHSTTKKDTPAEPPTPVIDNAANTCKGDTQWILVEPPQPNAYLKLVTSPDGTALQWKNPTGFGRLEIHRIRKRDDANPKIAICAEKVEMVLLVDQIAISKLAKNKALEPGQYAIRASAPDSFNRWVNSNWITTKLQE